MSSFHEQGWRKKRDNETERTNTALITWRKKIVSARKDLKGNMKTYLASRYRNLPFYPKRTPTTHNRQWFKESWRKHAKGTTWGTDKKILQKVWCGQWVNGVHTQGQRSTELEAAGDR